MAAITLGSKGLKLNEQTGILSRPAPGRENRETSEGVYYDMAVSEMMITSANSFLRGISCTILDEAGPFWFGLGRMQPRPKKRNIEVMARASEREQFFREQKMNYILEVRDGWLYADLHHQKSRVEKVSRNSVVEISLRDGTEDTLELLVNSAVVHTFWEEPSFPLEFLVLVDQQTFGDVDLLQDLRWVGLDRVQLTDELGIVESRREPGVLETLRVSGSEGPAMIASEFCIEEDKASHPVRGGVSCIVTHVAGEWMIGLATSANNRDVSSVDDDIDFALVVNDGTLAVLERNREVSQSVPVQRGDELLIMVKPQRVRANRAATAVQYWHNGRPFHTSRTPPTFPLYAKISCSADVKGELLEGLHWVANEPPRAFAPEAGDEPAGTFSADNAEGRGHDGPQGNQSVERTSQGSNASSEWHIEHTLLED